MRTRATVAHRIPGRARLLIAGQRGNQGFFDELSQRISAVEGVRRVRANPIAGTVVLEHDGTFEELMQRSGLHDVIEIAEGSSGPPHADAASAASVTAAYQARPLNLVSGRDLNPMFMAGAAFSLLALLQTFRGQVFVPAATAFWYAVTSFQQAGFGAQPDGLNGQ